MPFSRPILPAPPPIIKPSAPASTSPPHAESSSSSSLPASRVHPKRELIKVACNKCRAKKVKCDGNRPVCTRCTDRRLSCHYDSKSIHETRSQILKRRFEQASSETSAYEEAISILAQLPEKEAVEHLRKLRTGNNASIAQILSIGRDAPSAVGDRRALDSVDAALDKPSMLQSVIPYKREDIEFELAVRHPIAYPTFHPVQAEMLATETLLKPSRAGRLPFDPVHDWSGSSQESLPEQAERSPQQRRRSSIHHHSSKLSTLLGSRGEPLNIGRWTDVPIEDALAVQVLSLYFQVDHQILPVLHEDLFLRDLVEGRPEFCTEFLVSALLSWACQTYAARDRRAAVLGVSFFHKAQGMADAESEKGDLTCVTAFELLSMTALSYARDDLSLRYLEAGARIGTELGLFNVTPDSDIAQAWKSTELEKQAAARHVSWGVFNWLCLHGLHYHTAVINAPPSLPLPGDDTAPLGKQPMRDPAHELGAKVFRASCQLWLIFLDVLCAYYDEQSPSIYPGSVDFAENTYRRLLRWADDLPLDLVWDSGSSFEVLMVHIYFHSVAIHLFRPPIERAQPPATLRSFEARNSSAARAQAASSDQLRRLILTYRLHHNDEGTLSILWHTGLVYLANSTLQGGGGVDVVVGQQHDSTERRFYFLLCIAGLEDLYVSFKVFGSITRALLAMALKQGAVSGDEAARLERNLRLAEPRHAAVDELIDGPQLVHWIVNLDLAMEDRRAAQGSSLADQFSELMIKAQGNNASSSMDTSGSP